MMMRHGFLRGLLVVLTVHAVCGPSSRPTEGPSASETANSEITKQPGHSQQNTCSFHLTKSEGDILWQGKSNSVDCHWLISLDPSHGVALKVDELSQDSDTDVTLTVHRGHESEPDTEVLRLTEQLPLVTIHGKSYFATLGFRVSLTLPGPGVLVHGHQAQVHLVTQARKSTEHDGCRASGTNASEAGPRIRFRYTAVRLETMPPRAKHGRYHCALPYQVPALLKCDMVRHCQGGEDEKCMYPGQCVGESVFGFNDVCYWFGFSDDPLSPTEAVKGCTSSFRLASLEDPKVLLLTARLAVLHGVQDVIVGAFRMLTRIQSLAHLYRFLWRWSGSSTDTARVIYDDLGMETADPRYQCGVLRVTPHPHVKPVSCEERITAGHICAYGYPWQQPVSAKPSVPERLPGKFLTQKCPDGSYTHPFLPCSFTSKGSSSGSRLPMFQCSSGQVHYTLACDGHPDCLDGSDELDCGKVFSLWPNFKCSLNPEVIPSERVCDGSADCIDETDETDCRSCQPGFTLCGGTGCVPDNYTIVSCGWTRNNAAQKQDLRTTAVEEESVFCSPDMTSTEKSILTEIDLDGHGKAVVTRTTGATSSCPETHFPCGEGTCIPIYLVKNRVVDCPYPHTEESMETLSCEGYYRCYGHQICLHNDHLCDGVYQCPLKDDERYCNINCTEGCQCEGYALTCNNTIPLSREGGPFWIRYLDVSGVPVGNDWLYGITFLPSLHFLNLSRCYLDKAMIAFSFYLRVLDLSFNNLTHLPSSLLWQMKRLNHLNLSHNPLFPELDMTLRTFLQQNRIHHLLSLSLRDTGIKSVDAKAFTGMDHLVQLDIRDNPVDEISREMFAGLETLGTLYTDDPRLCCTFFSLYPTATTACHAPVDELSSCEDLLRTDGFRVFLWLIAVLAITGNIWVFVYRLFQDATRTSRVFRVLVANLCVSDFLMGVYLIVIGSADARYKGEFLWQKRIWTQSSACHAAGCLALLSSEVSAFIICLITLDRVLVLRFPLKQSMHLTSRSAMAASGVAWMIGLALAVVPLLPGTSHWEFYSQTGICLPLPITRRAFPGQHYAFSVFIALNFVLFLLIGVGQVTVFCAIRNSAMASKKDRRDQDLVIARRLFLIVLSDFCCWFPIGLMGLLAARGTPIPGVLNVWSAIFVLPLNSAINPFLYTLNTFLEKRRERLKKCQTDKMLLTMYAEMLTWPCEHLREVRDFTLRLLRSKGSRPLISAQRSGENLPLASLATLTSARQEDYDSNETSPKFYFSGRPNFSETGSDFRTEVTAKTSSCLRPEVRQRHQTFSPADEQETKFPIEMTLCEPL